MKHSQIEALEARIAPAVLTPVDIFVDATTVKVSLAAGVLKVLPMPGATDLDLSIQQLPDGSILIADAGGDDDLEDVANLTGVVKGLNVVLSSGDDHLSVALDADHLLRGAIVINAGAGDDQVAVSEGSIQGNLTILAKGSADVELGGGGLTVKGLVQSSTAGGTFSLDDDAVVGSLQAVGANDFILAGAVKGNATLIAKAGDTSFLVGSVGAGPLASVGGNLQINGVGGADDVFLGHATIHGTATLNLGAGDNFSTVSADTTIFGVARIIGTLGNDTVAVGTIGGAGPVIHGRLGVVLGAGTNAFTGGSGLISGGLTYNGGTGADTVILGDDLVLSGSAILAAGDGTNTVSVSSFSALTKFVLGTGKDADTVYLGAAGDGFVAGVVALGDGADSLTFLGASDFFTTFKVDGGLGSDTLSASPDLLDAGLLAAKFETVI